MQRNYGKIIEMNIEIVHLFPNSYPVADPGENLTGALHSNFGLGGCGGRG